MPLAVVDHVKQVLWTFAIASGNSETIPSVTLHSLSLDGLIGESRGGTFDIPMDE